MTGRRKILNESHPSLLSLSLNFYNHCLCSIHDTLIRAQMELSLHIQSTYHTHFDFLGSKQQSEVLKKGERIMGDTPECQHYYLSGLHYQYYGSSFSIDRKNNYITSMLFELIETGVPCTLFPLRLVFLPNVENLKPLLRNTYK